MRQSTTSRVSIHSSDPERSAVNSDFGFDDVIRGYGVCERKGVMTISVASNWEREQGLSLFGRWHMLSLGSEGGGHALCGKYVYASPDRIPTYYRRLQRISSGVGKTAPTCRKCERAVQARGW